MRISQSWPAIALLLAACGGGDPPRELTFDSDSPTATVSPSAVVKGHSFVPLGSTCPASNEFIVIGSLGAHTIAYRNETTGTSGPVFDQLWVCNSDSGRSMSWISNPIALQAGANRITVTMSDGQRSSSATTTVTRN